MGTAVLQALALQKPALRLDHPVAPSAPWPAAAPTLVHLQRVAQRLYALVNLGRDTVGPRLHERHARQGAPTDLYSSAGGGA